MTHPLDSTLVLSAQLRSDMTTLANVTAKVRKNGGTATTYTNVSSPAITQNSDITYGYELQIAANTYAAGDVIDIAWLYSGTAYAYATETIGLASVDGAHYTTGRGDNLANLDAAISTRSTYAGADTSGTTTLLSRLTSGRATNLDNLDATVSSRSTVAAIWAAVVDSTGVTTLLSRLTSGRATNLDNLDAAVSTRLATSGYTAPDNAGIAAIEAKTDLLGAGVVTYGGPVLNASRVEIVQGDDYLEIDGRALSWTSTDWPDLTGATVTLDIVRTVHPHTENSYPADVISETQVDVELTAIQTADLHAGTWSFALKATLTDLSVVTLAQGVMVVLIAPAP